MKVVENFPIPIFCGCGLNEANQPNHENGFPARVARFFLIQNTKTEKMYQITTNYTKCP
jgi:hypothetical protein